MMLRTFVNNSILCRYLVLILSFCIVEHIYAQKEKESLSSKRNKILKEIELTSRLIESTKKKKGENIQYVRLLNSKISKRKQLINSYNSEISAIDNKIVDRKISISKYEQELLNQKRLYAEFIQYSYKNHNHYSTAIYLLASKNFNQFYLRKKYLEQLKDARIAKIELIDKIQIRIESEISELDSQREDRKNAISKLEQERLNLTSEKKGREKTVKLLANEEKGLKKQLRDKRKIELEIASRLEALIKEEAKKSKYAKLTPEDKLVSVDFEKNKGRLPWPTMQGVITEKFGEHYHPVIKGVKVRNNGIDITTSVDEQVRAIFSGEISKIFAIKGANYTVIVRHGSYYTVYHNLYDLKVNVGDKIGVKDYIGKVSKSKTSDNSTVHFEIWKGLVKLNPEEWISN